MNDRGNVLDLLDESFRRGRTPRHDGGGGGTMPPMDELIKKVSALEEFAGDARERLARIETRLESTATREDVERLRTELHSTVRDQTWKFITWMTGIVLAAMGGAFAIARYVH